MRGGERGSVLMLMPAAVLVLFVLGALAVDAGLAFLGQRTLADAAAAAANDAAALGLSDAAFYGGAEGALVLEEATATRVAHESVVARQVRGLEVVDRIVVVRGPQVCVHLTGRVPYLFAPVVRVPGVPRSVVVHGRAVATAVRGAAGTPVPTARDMDC